jgi:hypothetical protein
MVRGLCWDIFTYLIGSRVPARVGVKKGVLVPHLRRLVTIESGEREILTPPEASLTLPRGHHGDKRAR